jgi:hypothetical protein
MMLKVVLNAPFNIRTIITWLMDVNTMSKVRLINRVISYARGVLASSR